MENKNKSLHEKRLQINRIILLMVDRAIKDKNYADSPRWDKLKKVENEILLPQIIDNISDTFFKILIH